MLAASNISTSVTTHKPNLDVFPDAALPVASVPFNEICDLPCNPKSCGASLPKPLESLGGKFAGEAFGSVLPRCTSQLPTGCGDEAQREV